MTTSRISGLNAALQPSMRVPANLRTLAARYRSARPFPHVVIDDLFAPQLLDALSAEAPARREDWIEYNREGLEKKFGQRSVIDLGRTGMELTGFLHSAAFLYFLTELTGVRELLPDPYLQGGGYSLIPPGGYFSPHIDRNIAYGTGLTRRLAMIIYLNKDWEAEYGGHLELWNAEGTRCEAAVAPQFNRTILFEVANPNYHAVREVACPPGRTRNSFLVYYHTVGLDGLTDPTPRGSIFAKQPELVNQMAFRDRMKDWTPPVLFRALKKMVKPAY